ncbi:SPOSA6832_04735, partial [Sporobolomyces salmonicolor]
MKILDAKPGKVSAEMEVKRHQGRTLAFTRIELESAKTGKLLAFGSHTKFIADALKSPKNIKLSEDGETIVEGTMPEGKELKN